MLFEDQFGKVRSQSIPCDGEIHTEDLSGVVLVAQLVSKLVGYLKVTPDYCVLLDVPIGGQGCWRSSEKYWVLESFSDSDWTANHIHRRSTSCGVHLLNV